MTQKYTCTACGLRARIPVKTGEDVYTVRNKIESDHDAKSSDCKHGLSWVTIESNRMLKRGGENLGAPAKLTTTQKKIVEKMKSGWRLYEFFKKDGTPDFSALVNGKLGSHSDGSIKLPSRAIANATSIGLIEMKRFHRLYNANEYILKSQNS